MTERPAFLDRLSGGPPVLMDGAVNTELTRRGLVFNTADWLRVNLDQPEVLAEIHKAYAEAGAELHIANSFAAGRHVLEAPGLGDLFEPINRAAVQLCRDAIDGAATHPQWIAGSISTYAADHDRANLPPPPELEANCRDQAAILAAAGADLIALEMLYDFERSIAMLRGSATTGLPVSVGLVCTQGPEGDLALWNLAADRDPEGNTPLTEALAQIVAAIPTGAQVILTAMHSAFETTGPAITAIRRVWDGPIGVYPNIGRYAAPGGWDTTGSPDPAAFADACEAWAAQGAAIIGGCCGVGSEHIAALARRGLHRREKMDARGETPSAQSERYHKKRT